MIIIIRTTDILDLPGKVSSLRGVSEDCVVGKNARKSRHRMFFIYPIRLRYSKDRADDLMTWHVLLRCARIARRACGNQKMVGEDKSEGSTTTEPKTERKQQGSGAAKLCCHTNALSNSCREVSIFAHARTAGLFSTDRSYS
eukprot:scaffold2103_cov185-Amphora_coffeaeformis.AAC.10